MWPLAPPFSQPIALQDAWERIRSEAPAAHGPKADTVAARSCRRSVTRNRKRTPGHDPIAITDGRIALDEVELETAHLIGCCRIRRAFEPSGEPLTTGDVAALRLLMCSHVFDRTLTRLHPL
jgi:hypothetical protein